ncbi:MAG: hypothetical protein AB7S78_14200 [Candidatus Omnitrophota bacterium]
MRISHVFFLSMVGFSDAKGTAGRTSGAVNPGLQSGGTANTVAGAGGPLTGPRARLAFKTSRKNRRKERRKSPKDTVEQGRVHWKRSGNGCRNVRGCGASGKESRKNQDQAGSRQTG